MAQGVGCGVRPFSHSLRPNAEHPLEPSSQPESSSSPPSPPSHTTSQHGEQRHLASQRAEARSAESSTPFCSTSSSIRASGSLGACEHVCFPCPMLEEKANEGAAAFLTVGMLLIACLTIETRLPPRRTGTFIDFTVFKDPAYSLFVAGTFIMMVRRSTLLKRARSLISHRCSGGSTRHSSTSNPVCHLFPATTQQLTSHADARANGVDRDLAFYALSILNAASLFGRLIPNVRSLLS